MQSSYVQAEDYNSGVNYCGIADNFYVAFFILSFFNPYNWLLRPLQLQNARPELIEYRWTVCQNW